MFWNNLDDDDDAKAVLFIIRIANNFANGA